MFRGVGSGWGLRDRHALNPATLPLFGPRAELSTQAQPPEYNSEAPKVLSTRKP